MRSQIIVAAVAAALPLTTVSATTVPDPIIEKAAQERVSVVVEGSGPDVILIPGLASSRDVWSGSAIRLRRTHRVHVVQVAGFAGTPAGPNGTGKVNAPVADAVTNYIARQRLKAPALTGHSLGGEIALMIGARHPGSVGRLIIVDALPFCSLLVTACNNAGFSARS